MTPRKNRINENSPDASPWPVRNFAIRALGLGTQPARKTEYGYEDVVGPDSKDDLIRKEFVVRFGRVHKRLQRIHKTSGATIAIVSYPKGMLHFQARLELWGASDQVKTAELLIVKEAAKGYPKWCVRTILMQAPVFHTEVYIPIGIVRIDLLGVGFLKLKELEAQTRAWIEVDTHDDGPINRLLWTTRLRVFGNRMSIYRALSRIHRAILKPYAGVETDMVEGEKKQQRDIFVSFEEATDSLFNNIEDLEALSGARIEDVGERYLSVRVVKIFGTREEIFQALKLVYDAQLKPYVPEDPEAAQVKEATDTEQVYVAETEHAGPSTYELPGGIVFTKEPFMSLLEAEVEKIRTQLPIPEA
ncbi:hypothetical protein QVD17_14498 [Tagetes erecta]|uniref:Uncharacterized protein n=1 Tax=Tagetes erecta TaxID=13708 RepID=A0AAD8KY92_TARER|nr:hypothetical protein QVD17_14498 [Tagetes erecta]